MKVIDITRINFEWTDLHHLHYHPQPTHTRSKNILHVSGIIEVIARKMKWLTKEDQDDEMPLVVLMGLAFEEMAARLYPHMIWQPGEVKRDGVVGSPDGFSEDIVDLPDDDDCDSALTPIIDEFKSTYKSLRTRGGLDGSNGSITDERMWMTQIMSYLGMDKRQWSSGKVGVGSLRERLWARLHVCWVCGDYSYPIQPIYLRYLIRFGRAEVENNWRLMMRYKDQAVKE